MLVKNIETKIRLALWVSMGAFITSIVIVITGYAYATSMIAQERSKIYVLDNNVPLVAHRTNIMDNRLAEYKAHVHAFHDYFFSLPPDNEYIEDQMKRAMYLIDESGAAQYNALKEKGYFTNIISSSSIITSGADSILIDENSKSFTFYGKQKIDRSSSTTLRSLVTTGTLKDVPRTENNPHGVLITGWKTLENKDLYNVPKKIF